MTLNELLLASYDELNQSATPSATVIARVKRWLNEGYQHVVRVPSLQGLRDVDIDLETVADRKTYGVQSIERIDRITNADNQIPLGKRSRGWLRDNDPGEVSEGTPQFWIPFGFQPVNLQPASTGLWVASSSASDTTQTARIIGIRANGDRQAQATVTLTGVTRVAIGTFTDFVAVLQFESTAVGVGAISLYDAASSGNELARIPIGSTSVQYQMFRLWPTPSAAETMRVSGQLWLTDLVNDVSVFRITPAFSDVLMNYVRFCDARKKRDATIMAIEMKNFKDGRDAMAAEAEYGGHDTGDTAHGTTRPSNLGGWFPSDSE